MQSQVDQISPVLVEVKVEVPWEKVNESLEGAYRNLQRTARVRGFRPGKVPRNVVKSLMGKSVERDVVERLIDEALAQVVQEHSLEPVSVAQMNSSEIAQGQSLNISAKLEVRPKIEEIDLSSLTVERTSPAVGEDEIGKELERLRQENVELVALDPARPAEDKDVVTIDIAVIVDGTPRPDLDSTDTRTELGAERLLPEISDGLRGTNVGDERVIALTFPEDYGNDALRGKPATFTVRVKDIQTQQLPELDDEFARDLEHESLEAMRTSVRTRLEEAQKRRTDSQLREAVIDRLVETNPVPVPPSLVERQEQALRQEYQQLEQLLGRKVPMNDALQASMRQRAERKIRAGLLFATLAEQQSITVEEPEVEARLKELADESGKHIAKVRAEYQGERRQWLSSQLLHDKLVTYLLSKATITDAPPATATEVPAGTP